MGKVSGKNGVCGRIQAHSAPKVTQKTVIQQGCLTHLTLLTGGPNPVGSRAKEGRQTSHCCEHWESGRTAEPRIHQEFSSPLSIMQKRFKQNRGIWQGWKKKTRLARLRIQIQDTLTAYSQKRQNLTTASWRQSPGVRSAISIQSQSFARLVGPFPCLK